MLNTSLVLYALERLNPNIHIYPSRIHLKRSPALLFNVSLMFAGTASVCDLTNLTKCLSPNREYFMAKHLSSCQCPDQCSKLTYNYAISQSVISAHAIEWVQQSFQPIVSKETILANHASLEVKLYIRLLTILINHH